uniref:Uncharacterized protein n=1 Tax=Aegilops tauschii TaxID=37682 RepID=N1QUM7_AEGTA
MAWSWAQKQAYSNQLDMELAQLRRENQMLIQRHRDLINKSWVHKWEKHIREKKMIARMEREQIIWRDRIPLFGVFMHFCLLSTVFALAWNK